jgi:hypothetical protein
MRDGKVVRYSLALIRQQAPVCSEFSEGRWDRRSELPRVFLDMIDQVPFSLGTITRTLQSSVEGEVDPQSRENVGQYLERF